MFTGPSKGQQITRYEQGFMRKCAEYGVDGRIFLEKTASKAGIISKLLNSIRKAKNVKNQLKFFDNSVGKRMFKDVYADNVPRLVGENPMQNRLLGDLFEKIRQNPDLQANLIALRNRPIPSPYWTRSYNMNKLFNQLGLR